MGRHYIGIEMGEHAGTHCAPRLNKVIEGEQGGISGVSIGRAAAVFASTGSARRSSMRKAISGRHPLPGAGGACLVQRNQPPWDGKGDSPLLGIQDGRAHALLYNGILGDKRPGGGNVLTRATLALIREQIAKHARRFDGPLTVYGEQSRLTPATLDASASRSSRHPTTSKRGGEGRT